MFDKKFTKQKIQEDCEHYRKILGCKTLYVLLDNPSDLDKISGVETITPRDCKPGFLENIDPSDWVMYALEHSMQGVEIIEKLIERNIRFLPVRCAEVGGYAYENPSVTEVLERQKVLQKLAGYAKFNNPGTLGDFVNLCQALDTSSKLPGDVVEIGCYRGSSGSVMLDYARTRKINKQFWFLDVFSGFNYEHAAKSTDQFWIGTHKTEGIDAVTQRLHEQAADPEKVRVVKSNIITDELPAEILEIAVCNLDVDMFEAVEAGLYKAAARMVLGGILICEDAGHTPALIGARVALERFSRSDLGKKFTPVYMPSGQVFLIRHS